MSRTLDPSLRLGCQAICAEQSWYSRFAFASAHFKNYPIVFFPFRYNTGASATRETLLWLLRALGADTWASVVAGAVASFWTSLLPAGTARESACAKRNMELVIYLLWGSGAHLRCPPPYSYTDRQENPAVSSRCAARSSRQYS